MENPAIKAENAADALDQIRAGGSHVLLIVNQRLAEVRDSLDGGRFIDALEAAQAACQRLAQLAAAQQAMGLFAHNASVRVGDLEVGMVIPGVGAITEIGPCPGCGQEDCSKLAFVAGGNSLLLDRDVEIVVERCPS